MDIKGKIMAKPFLKWAGGKAQLIETIDEYISSHISSNKIKTYVEPFVGGGAVFFYVIQKYNFQKFVLLDTNKDLIQAYANIKKESKVLLEILEEIFAKFNECDFEGKSEYFYQMRDEFNLRDENTTSLKSIRHSALLIFLNKTCFNGLYRVNKSNKYNVPFGKYKSPKYPDVSNILAISDLLNNCDVELFCNDFTFAENYVSDNTFVYLDPPYRPISTTSSFNSYNANVFCDNEQIRLAEFIKRIDKKGALVMLSNSDPKNCDENDNFFDELYKGFKIHRINAKRMINSNSTKRGSINELLITNF